MLLDLRLPDMDGMETLRQIREKNPVVDVIMLTGHGSIDTAIEAIRTAFGSDLIDSDGGLDRARMRELVFADAQAKGRLEAILHPMIGLECNRQALAASGRTTVFDVPLLAESAHWRAHVHLQEAMILNATGPREDRISFAYGDIVKADLAHRTARRSGAAWGTPPGRPPRQPSRREMLSAASVSRGTMRRRVASSTVCGLATG